MRDRESVGRNRSFGYDLDCNSSVSNSSSSNNTTTNHHGSHDVNSALR